MSSVVLSNIGKSFGSLEVMKGVDLTVEAGEFCVFVGPSGCGKSTLLRMISGLETSSAGQIFIDGKDVTGVEPSARGIAMVFQSYALYPHLTVRENIGFGLSLARRPKTEIEEKVKQTADILQLSHLLDRKPKALSGGQRQRVAIGRAIIRNPKVFLFDEPLSNLDASLRSQMRFELTELHAKLGATMIYVTHDQVEAMTMADKIVVLNGGRIEQIGAPMTLYNHPATPFVAGFIGSPKMNIFEGEVAEREGCRIYGVRPEHVALSTTQGKWQGVVRHIERLGADTVLHLDVPDLPSLVVRADGDSPVSIGETLFASPVAGKEHSFV
ncbi:ABC transporter ATP-binding protein [Agrobacterium sp. SHOUNA12C]|uniref:ABC transporter ATP-binding protein n=1 Tax=Rhizobium rhizogenes NBRC 13257 TaxID=1220581 RepID=A0AA87U7L5_RHIRH|nr:ABC transporter ATP-binding protein [Rhizobium rhizogenes]KAA6485397.1 ABC transporter ATP-binding protein [Agrobacterium sp. ICMP 7243]MCJ9723447.1 ABC transporter ATP-binding protein [Agrobacterium sp. BETTINA12B]MCJ9758776.1 ABC transporter ATP-binding protein [Agrobacterium sp. SHOUNA12C]OCJ08764.1 sugar ABC transporter ATP-binding protein [Agrobacterium sp. B131/95]OCJ14152.1 sugar ABC transporter ATP-binding protein [Agrobacterium sp. B133/95]